jgi:hypothetical protein
LTDGVTSSLLADGISDLSTARAMGLVPVNALQATSAVGHSPEIDDEFIVRHIASSRPNHTRKTLDDH